MSGLNVEEHAVGRGRSEERRKWDHRILAGQSGKGGGSHVEPLQLIEIVQLHKPVAHNQSQVTKQRLPRSAPRLQTLSRTQVRHLVLPGYKLSVVHRYVTYTLFH